MEQATLEADRRTDAMPRAVPPAQAPSERFGIRLVPPNLLIKTGPVDCANWAFRPVLGYISCQRFRMVVKLIPSSVGRLLEIGYGSGTFMPELSCHAGELIGLDVHNHSREVGSALSQLGLSPTLYESSAETLPFADGEMDVIVAVSCLEFIPDLDAAVAEFRRVLRPDGVLIAITPKQSSIADAGLRLLTGRSAEEDFQRARLRVIPSLLRSFSIDRTLQWPSPVFTLYTALRLRPLQQPIR